MSRQQWHDSFGPQTNNIDSLLSVGRPSEKTDDPEARDYDEATEIFCNGVKLARNGDFKAGASQIACAFFLSSRSINFVHGKLTDDMDESTKNKLLDYELLREIAVSDVESMACSIMAIILGQYLGSNPDLGQTFIAGAMIVIEKLLKSIEVRPEIENPDNMILGGVLTRTNLLYQRSVLHMSMGNRKKAAKDLTKAIHIDEFFTQGRESRAALWEATNQKDDKTIHGEYKRVVNEYHPDNRRIGCVYAWLATTTLKDPSLGTIYDAKSYYQKSIQATIRRDEIYGRRDDEPPLERVQNMHAQFQPHLENLQNPRYLEMVERKRRDTTGIAIETQEERTTKYRHVCVTCGAGNKADGGQCSKCSRCKSVSYCSKECQLSDWKSHKRFCHTIKNKKKILEPLTPAPTASTVMSSSNDENYFSRQTDEYNSNINTDDQKEKLDLFVANTQTSKRMELELRALYENFGKGFSGWWNEMTFDEKKELLLLVTNHTIPLTEPTTDEILFHLELSSSEMIVSRALFEYNVNNLCGTCDCNADNCDHHFKDFILHEIYRWVNFTEKKQIENIEISTRMKDSGIFPERFSGKTVFVVPPKEGEIIKFEPIMEAVHAPEDVVQRHKDWLQQGVVYDASAALYYAITRQLFSLSLLVRLFDEYQIRGRRQSPVNPMSRLSGCGTCRGSCSSQLAKQCGTCKGSWFCSNQCMIEANHFPCPHGREMASVVIFR